MVFIKLKSISENPDVIDYFLKIEMKDIEDSKVFKYLTSNINLDQCPDECELNEIDEFDEMYDEDYISFAKLHYHHIMPYDPAMQLSTLRDFIHSEKNKLLCNLEIELLNDNEKFMVDSIFKDGSFIIINIYDTFCGNVYFARLYSKENSNPEIIEEYLLSNEFSLKDYKTHIEHLEFLPTLEKIREKYFKEEKETLEIEEEFGFLKIHLNNALSIILYAPNAPIEQIKDYLLSKYNANNIPSYTELEEKTKEKLLIKYTDEQIRIGNIYHRYFLADYNKSGALDKIKDIISDLN
jgi:hypothetical protein